MAFEITRQEIIKQANDLLRLYQQTRDKKYKDEEIRLRRIVTELESIVIGGGGGGAVDRIIAGTNISISPTGGTGNVTINATTLVPDPTGYGSFYSAVTQTLAAANTPQAVTLGSTYEANGTSTSGSRIYLDKAGTYQFSYVAQVANNANSQEYAEFWIKYNGVEYPNSNTRMILQQRKSAGQPSEQLMTLIINGTSLNDNDYIELFWEATSTQVSLKYEPANATYPATPSIIANIIPIGAQGRDSNLNELNDVTITSPVNNQLLRYNSGIWENWTPNFLTTVPTLAQVTTAGNTTTNSVTIGGINSTADYALRVDNGTANVRLGRFRFIRSVFDPTGVAASIDFWRSGGGAEGILAFSTNSGTVGDNATERMRITTSGNVLIGTTIDSTYKLDIVGNLRTTTSSLLAGVVVQRNDTNENVIQITQATGASAAHLYSRGDGYLGWIGIRGTNGTRRFAFESNPNIDSGSHFNLIMYDSAGTNSLTNWTVTRTLFTVAQTFRTNTDTYLSATSGRVGIGISPAGAKLTVLGADETSDGVIAIQTPGATYLKLGGNTTYSWIQSFNSKPLYINALGNNVVFSGAGNVLIGTTTSSTYKLDVNGTFRTTGKVVLNNATGNNRPLEVSSNEIVVADFRNTGNTNAYLDIIGSGGSSTQMRLGVFGTNVGITRGGDNDPDIVINSSNNIGIGTISPFSRLHVEGASVTYNLIAPTGNPTFRMADSVTSGTRKEFTIILDNTNNRVDIQAVQQGVANRNITINASGGNVGIGTTNPIAPLQVVGTNIAFRATLANGDGGIISNDATISNFQALTGGNAARDIGISGKEVIFRSGTVYSESMRIFSSRNVAIGNNVDNGFKLDVNGSVNSTEYNINGIVGYSGIMTIPTNPPGQQNIDIQGGIIVNIF
jgi:hypothetical protein